MAAATSIASCGSCSWCKCCCCCCINCFIVPWMKAWHRTQEQSDTNPENKTPWVDTMPYKKTSCDSSYLVLYCKMTASFLSMGRALKNMREVGQLQLFNNTSWSRTTEVSRSNFTLYLQVKLWLFLILMKFLLLGIFAKYQLLKILGQSCLIHHSNCATSVSSTISESLLIHPSQLGWLQRSLWIASLHIFGWLNWLSLAGQSSVWQTWSKQFM